jgi:hypothetical protein
LYSIRAVYGLFTGRRNPPDQRERSVTSEAGGAAELQRRTKMSLTIMTEIMINRMVVTALRRRGGAASRGVGRRSGMVVPSGRENGLQRLRARHLGLRHGSAGRHDHAPGAVKRALGQFEAEQAVALERVRQ